VLAVLIVGLDEALPVFKALESQNSIAHGLNFRLNLVVVFASGEILSKPL
jgi:hypothetical protein